jgi:hypothetical protein
LVLKVLIQVLYGSWDFRILYFGFKVHFLILQFLNVEKKEIKSSKKIKKKLIIHQAHSGHKNVKLIEIKQKKKAGILNNMYIMNA